MESKNSLLSTPYCEQTRFRVRGGVRGKTVKRVMSEKSYDPDSASAESFDADDVSSKGFAASSMSEKSYDPDSASAESFDADDLLADSDITR